MRDERLARVACRKQLGLSATGIPKGFSLRREQTSSSGARCFARRTSHLPAALHAFPPGHRTR